MKLSKILKYALTLTAAALLLHGASAHSEDKKAPAKQPPAKEQKAPAKAERAIKLEVTEDGFVPSPIKLKKDEPVALQVTRKTDKTCATELVMKDYNINQDLPLNQEVTIHFTPSKSGTLKYGCGMGQMISGQFVVE